MRKNVKFVSVLLLSATVLASCGNQDPTETVSDFFKTFQKGDYEKLDRYVVGGLGDTSDTELLLFQSASEHIEYSDPVELLTTDEASQVKIEVSSIDVGQVLRESLDEVESYDPFAYANAEPSEQEKMDKAYAERFHAYLEERLDTGELQTESHTLTLNLTKNRDGDYIIVPDETLLEALLPNYMPEF